MTREQIKKLFPDATDEQITELLNTTNSEVAKERGKADKLKADNEALRARADEAAALAADLQAKADEAEQGKLTEMEKLQKELEKANGQIADMQKAAFVRDQKSAAALKFNVTAEQAEKIVKDDGTVDFDILGQIMSEKESAAALAKEQEIAANSSNPGGGSAGGNGGDGKSKAESIASKLFGQNQTAGVDIIHQYANGGK